MGAALSIVVLFFVSSTIVRVASVFLERTGVAREVARIQALSALSGTGFTTSESEQLLQAPERRRILTTLMVTGSVGLASVVATVVVGAFGIKETLNGFLLQLAAIIAAILFVRYVVFSQYVDGLISGLAHAWFIRRKAHAPYTVLYQLAPDNFIAEHVLAASPPENTAEWPGELMVLGVKSRAMASLKPWDNTLMPAGSVLTLAGPRASQKAFADAYGKVATPEH